MDRLTAARRWLVLPVETKARELDAKALLAFSAAERGWGTILGTTRVAQAAPLPRGVYLGNGISHGQSRTYGFVRERGSRTAAWCEEGLVYWSAADYGRRKVDPAAYGLLDVFFAWGANQASDMIDGLGCDRRTLVVSGNPRFDVLRPELRAALDDRVAALRARYGRFLLVNTNLNKYNHYFGAEFYVRRARGTATTGAPAAEAWARGAVLFQEAIMREMLAAVRALSERFGEHVIVIRPHPSENHARWKDATADLPHVEVAYEGNVAEWLLAAEVAIHNNCTTGVEAYLLEKPAIAFRPVRDGRFDLRLPNALSAEAVDVPALTDLVARRLAGEPLPDVDDHERLSVAREYIAGIDATPACDTILDTLDGLEIVPDALRPEAAAEGVPDVEGLPRTPRAWDAERAVRYRSYVRQKCDGIDAEEVTAFLAATRRATGRFDAVEVTRLQDDLVCVY